MKIATIALTVALTMPVAALAQAVADSNAESISQSGAQSAVILEGSSYPRNTPGLGGIGVNTTTPCSVGTGAGIVVPGAGVQFSGGKVDKGCVTRQEAAMLADLMNMPSSPGKRAAIHHACAFSDTLRHTLVAIGACRMVEP